MLNKDVLGLALQTAANNYNDIEVDVTDAAAVDAYRLNFWKVIAEQIINHFKTAGVVTVTVATTGTATAHTGTGSGTIQ